MSSTPEEDYENAKAICENLGLPPPEVAFTDDDLKRLKEFWTEEKYIGEDREKLLALIDRLEAAEDAMFTMKDYREYGGFVDIHRKAFDKWRKAAGK